MNDLTNAEAIWEKGITWDTFNVLANVIEFTDGTSSVSLGCVPMTVPAGECIQTVLEDVVNYLLKFGMFRIKVPEVYNLQWHETKPNMMRVTANVKEFDNY